MYHKNASSVGIVEKFYVYEETDNKNNNQLDD
jgi:hypothetical protein